MAARRNPAPKLASTPVAASSPGVAGLRQAISGALSDGFKAKAMLLRLSRRDLALLKRSPEVGLHEIRFSEGAMSFLDVPVAAEPTEVSHLDRGDGPAAGT
jgi:hypothetical protein